MHKKKPHHKLENRHNFEKNLDINFWANHLALTHYQFYVIEFKLFSIPRFLVGKHGDVFVCLYYSTFIYFMNQYEYKLSN